MAVLHLAVGADRFDVARHGCKTLRVLLHVEMSAVQIYTRQRREDKRMWPWWLEDAMQ